MPLPSFFTKRFSFSSSGSRAHQQQMEEFYDTTVIIPLPNGYQIPKIFRVPKRYQNLTGLSCGAQGSVVKADDVVTGRKVAIKKMEEFLNDCMNSKRTYRELVLLINVKHPNIIGLLNAFTTASQLEQFEDLYLVTELMDMNLTNFSIKGKKELRTISFLVYQLLCAIRHLHNCGIIHRDLKPSNIAINADCTLKVLDFGLARRMVHDSQMTSYVVTRNYRAPEIIGELGYDNKMDVWSIGCIVAEMIIRRVLFPGENSLDQWRQILSILGAPKKEFFDRYGIQISENQLEMRTAVPFEEVIPDRAFAIETQMPQHHLTADLARDLLKKMLVIDPEHRITVDNALNHPFVSMWKTEKDMNVPINNYQYDDAIELEDRTTAEWKG
ncbi:hypothetical protein WR25_00825 isoform D [Diploscapter pachys]|uniref:Stress-activated protein kinase JNK n=1 Tax=Diploscapter pachys TaxID=2018661 RepID=A0A2A2JUW0_9BILA|nr:hypothetical protein WR25_00825 isoform D [Diploscapter pachys]